MLRLSPAALACFALACRDDAPLAPAARPGEAPALIAAAPLASRAVAGELGFDLAALPDGALLVTADRDGGVSALLLDRDGAARGSSIRVAAPSEGKAFEVAATSLGSRLGVAFALQAGGGAAASFGALGDAATRTFSAPLGLGESAPKGAAESGFVAISASEESGFVALRRGLDEPCEGDAGRSCASFGFREILPGGVEKRGLSLSVPAPCSRPLAGFVSSDDRWHYGLCSQEQGTPLTTHFMRQLTPFYVDVHSSLRGCAPLGATELAGAAVFVGDCPKGRRGVRVAGMGSKVVEIDLSQASVDCALGRPHLRAPGDGALDLTLREARAGLELLLPSRLSPGRSRAVWTGTSVLAGTWLAGEVVIRRFQCRGSELVPA